MCLNLNIFKINKKKELYKKKGIKKNIKSIFSFSFNFIIF